MVRVEGLERVMVPQPPEDLMDRLSLQLARMGYRSDNGDYYPRVRVTKGDSVEEMPAEDLLPEHMKKLYGYSRSKRAALTDCHRTVALFVDPRLEGSNAEQSIRMKCRPLATDEIRGFGDVVDIVNIRTNILTGEVRESVVHRGIFVGDNLLYSKLGYGTAAPFFLQPMDQIVRDYGVEVDHPTVRTEIRYWRKKE